MKNETVRIELQYSRAALAFVIVAASATVAVALLLPVSLALRTALASLACALGLEAARRTAFQLGPHGVRRFTVQRDGTIEVEAASGSHRVGVLRPGSFVAPWLTVMRWRPAGARRDRTVAILPDMVAAEEFRRLRVLLRWG
ncbi:MAG TPA: protein YgfX [Usitatibacter sp.]|nr:protein YgfX [Usitatibacter sp.]